MKAINIISIIVAAAFAAVIIYYAEAVWQARLNDWNISSLESENWNELRQAPKVTFEAGLVTMCFFLFFVFVNISNMIKVKTMTTRVLSIIGISLNGIIMLWCGLMLTTPTHLSFDEVSGGWIVFAGVMLAFSIVYLVQVIRGPVVKTNPEILDDIV